MSALDTRQRDSTLRELQNTTFDLLIIGGGITGAGILREASLRGLNVALVEAEDFASGTSSKSTKLIHGGIRYLAMGHVHVVREAARERKRVHELAPHLAEPQWLMLPSSNLIEFYKYRLGVNIYEQLGQVGSDDLHFNLDGRELAEREPLLDINRYSRACIYREYLTDDARLVLANIRAGVDAGGTAMNKLRVTGVIKENARVSAVRARCGVTDEEIIIRSKGVINAAGPWVESICDLDGLPSEKPLVLSKGIHIVIPHSKLPLNEMVLMVAKDDRPVFAIPRGSVVYIGTTDTSYESPANIWPEVLASEIEYLFKPILDYFNVELTHSDCLSTWAGLRPLISQRGKSTKEISRRDEIWVSKSGLITIAGGKLTGYRKMAEDTVDKATELLDLAAKDSADDISLPGGDFTGGINQQIAMLANRQLEEGAAMRLTRLYGTEASDVLDLDSQPLTQGSHVLSGEVKWAVRQEGATNLEDVLYRRTRAAYYRPSEVNEILEPASILLGSELGWTESKRIEECDSVRSRLLQDSVT
jgi:glycerol-3-phosphate dehydrogenase